MNEDQIIRRDRMRFKKNKLSANLSLLAIVLDALYFVSIYQKDVGSYYYRWIIGVSIIYNLVFMLAAFLCEEGVKNYKKNYSYPQVVLGLIQIARIFILPLDAHKTTILVNSEPTLVMGNGQFIYLVILLAASAVCLFVSAVINYIKCTALEAHMKMLEEQSAVGAMASKSA